MERNGILIKTVMIFLSIWFSLLNIEAFSQVLSSEDRFPNSIPCEIHIYEEEILQSLHKKRENLVSLGILPAKEKLTSRSMITQLEWPLRQVSGYETPVYYSFVNHVDLDPSSGIQDYNCGDKSYDGHNGNDISIFPFWWDMMNDNRVEVIAAAPGVIISKQDGEFDMNCSCTGTWNAIYVEHGDGSVAWYGHLKSGSLTSKPEGASVSTGEYLGLVGSSGCSTNPHLHLEIRDVGNNVIEPFAGTCNTTTTASWWVTQRDYWIPTINALYTHDIEPAIDFCPDSEATNFENNFLAGDLVYYGMYLSDQEDGLAGTFEVRDPNGDLVHAWSMEFEGQYRWAWWFRDDFSLPIDAVPGLYTFRGTYNGEVYEHYFMVSCPQSIGIDFATIRDRIVYQASSSIVTSNEITVYSAGGLSAFQAGDFVLINDPFTVTHGSEFVSMDVILNNLYSTFAHLRLGPNSVNYPSWLWKTFLKENTRRVSLLI